VVIEFLTVDVAPDQRDAWLERDDAVWTAFLAQQPGFLGKERWVARDDPSRVHLVISWASWAAWEAVPDAEMAEIDARMGAFRREAVCRAYDVV
jgi:uncharacterized protein (TIGR03792 family)